MNWLTKKWFKTQPFKHQLKALKRSVLLAFFALLMEQGTGKSWVIVLTAAILWRMGLIDLVIILAPKGVAPGWIRTQFPEHCPEDVRYVAALWKSKSNMTRVLERQVEAVLTDKSGALKVIAMNLEAFGSGADALDFVIGVLDEAQSALVVVDESHRIKSPDAHVTKRIVNLRIRSAYRRILTGTIADKPFDLFTQYGFLDPSILETPSFAAFRTEYAEMLPPSHGLLRHLIRRIPKVWKGRYIKRTWEEGWYIDNLTGASTENPRDLQGDVNPKKYTEEPTEEATDSEGKPRARFMEPKWVPNIVATNSDGTPRYKNLEKLHELTAPHSFRVLKRDCLDLPPKLYTRYYTELLPRQAALYAQARDNLRIEWENGRVTTMTRLTAMLRLQQIVCGYVSDDTGRVVPLFDSWKENPRIQSAMEFIEDRPKTEYTIIWCRFIEDILRMSEALRESYGARSVVQFYGATSDREREEAVARFEGERTIMKGGKVLRKEPVELKDRARFMIAQQRAGGVGQTWVAASLSFHYSNSFSLIDRLQAEDRPHRIGQFNPVQYTDLEAEGTIDERIITALVAKKDVADIIQGDEGIAWLT